MATITHVSSPASGAVAVDALIDTLLSAGWRITRWSDATNYTDATGAPLAVNPYGSGGSGAGNLGNTSAWFTVRASDSSREWLFQRGASDAAWTINRSKAGFVTGGTATVLPTATDATALFSSAAAFATIPGRLFISADDADGYGWRLMCIPSGGGNVLTLLADVPLDSPDPSDTDPYLWVGYYNPTGLTVYAAGGAALQSGSALIYKRFVGAGSNQRVTFASLTGYGGRLAPPEYDQGGALPSSGYDVPLPVPVMRAGAPSTTTGWVGFARGIRWATVQGRASGQTLDGTTEYWIYAAGLWLRWDSSTPTLA
jgi:hypothetical protein